MRRRGRLVRRKRLRRAADDVDFLQLAAGEEAQEAAVG